MGNMMNNITLNSMLKEFSVQNSLTEKDTLKFEKFVSYSLLANDYRDSFDLEGVGLGNCVGVDSVAIAISDVIVYSEEEAKKFTVGQFDVCFNFIQTKTSSSLDLGDYLKFLNTVYVFFYGTEQDQPDELKTAFLIKAHIYDKAAKFRSQPILKLHYAYTGIGVIADENFKSQVDNIVNQIRCIPYCFSDVCSNTVGAVELANHYKECLNRTTKKLMFQRHVALPKLTSATAAYLGVAKCVDYVELLKNQTGQINKGAFYDNVRDFLGATNPVNADIESTINSVTQRNLFSVLNNGVTLVAKKVTPSGDTFEISGYQVVNGCQTSHVLFNNKGALTDDMYLTVKLIETNNIDLSSSVIKATNSQSLVMKEAFATTKPYHKQLEDFFVAMNNNGHRFFYERRPHQYDEDESVLKIDVVSAPLLIKSFVSVVLEEPHQVHYYYGQILKDYNNEKSTLVFDESHHPGLYFLSHLICSKAKDVALKNKLSPWTYHIALLVKKILGVDLNVTKKITDNFVLESIKKVEAGFCDASNVALDVIKSANLRKNENMIPEKTSFIMSKLKEVKENNHRCMVKADVGSTTVISDGNYRVKNLRVENSGVVVFNYGSKSFSIKCADKNASFGHMNACQISVKDGVVIQVRE